MDRGLTPGAYAGGGKYYRTATGSFIGAGERHSQDGFATLEAARAQQHLNMQIKMFGYGASNAADSSNSHMLHSTVAQRTGTSGPRVGTDLSKYSIPIQLR